MNDRDIDNLTGSEEFAKRLTGVLNDGALCLMLSIGHQTGLFDTMASLPASTSAQIAEAAGLDERYVREWLAAMTTGRIVDHDPNQLTFALPPERAAWLTTGAGPANMAVPAQYIGLLALVEDKIVDCFRAGGGVPYSAYPKFQALMAQDSGAVHDAALIDVILPLVPGLVDELRAGIDVADIGCGSGHAVNLMATAYPASRFIGIDISDTGLAAGTAEAERRGLTNVRFQNQDAAGLSGSKQYNLITTFDAIHDQAHPDLVLTNIARLLRPSGALSLRRRSRLKRAGRQSRPPLGAVRVHNLVHALRDRVPCRRRDGAGRNVGRTAGPPNVGPSWLHVRRDQTSRWRHI
jgi:2-polyprenyl-3-methyl-5-hydroxy-6-metoxy-1,4-benzoquinol methylase